MKKSIIMVVNPISGDVDKAQFVETANFFAEKENLELILYETSGDGDVVKIRELYNEHQPERILVAGGDGTIKMVAEAIEKHDVILGILPAGSANGLSVDLNLPLTLEENLEIAFYGNYIEMDMIAINGKVYFSASTDGGEIFSPAHTVSDEVSLANGSANEATRCPT